MSSTRLNMPNGLDSTSTTIIVHVNQNMPEAPFYCTFETGETIKVTTGSGMLDQWIVERGVLGTRPQTHMNDEWLIVSIGQEQSLALEAAGSGAAAYQLLNTTPYVVDGLHVFGDNDAGPGLVIDVTSGDAYIPGSPGGPRQTLTSFTQLTMPDNATRFVDWNGTTLHLTTDAAPAAGYLRLASVTATAGTITNSTDLTTRALPTPSGTLVRCEVALEYDGGSAPVAGNDGSLVVPFDTVNLDPVHMASPDLTTITFPILGMYVVRSTVTVNATAAGDVILSTSGFAFPGTGVAVHTFGGAGTATFEVLVIGWFKPGFQIKATVFNGTTDSATITYAELLVAKLG